VNNVIGSQVVVLIKVFFIIVILLLSSVSTAASSAAVASRGSSPSTVCLYNSRNTREKIKIDVGHDEETWVCMHYMLESVASQENILINTDKATQEPKSVS